MTRTDAVPSQACPLPRAATVLRLVEGFALSNGSEVLFARPCEQRLLAVLAIRGRTTRGALAGQLWPDSTNHRAHGSLRTTLWRIAGLLPELVVAEHDHLALDRSVLVDLRPFRAWVARLRGAGPVAEADLGVPEMGNGELLPGWYDDWVILERERHRQDRLHALDRLARELGLRRRYAEAIDVTLDAVWLDPFRETAHRTLIELHLAENNVGEARRHFHDFARLLRTELGVEPSPALAGVVARHPSLTGALSSAPGGTSSSRTTADR